MCSLACLAAVVTETTIHSDVLLSEKTFKPIIGLRPFLILGDQNLYKKLVEMGFDVFEDMGLMVYGLDKFTSDIG